MEQEQQPQTQTAPRRDASLSIVVRRTIKAPPPVVFKAWTDPRHVIRWFGPRGVTCTNAEIDLRAGGRYRYTNRVPSGSTVVIGGVFERVEIPRRLTFTWAHEPADDAGCSRVDVRFEPRGDDAAHTELILVHTKLPSEAACERHRHGWIGCFDRLGEELDPA